MKVIDKCVCVFDREYLSCRTIGCTIVKTLNERNLKLNWGRYLGDRRIDYLHDSTDDSFSKVTVELLALLSSSKSM